MLLRAICPLAIVAGRIRSIAEWGMYDWSDVRFFLAVARGGSTLAAARVLRVNQTTVVRRIEALEAALKTQLFVRNQDGYRLSEAGDELLAQAERVAIEADTLERLAAQRRRTLSGVIRVTTIENLASLILTPMLAEFIELYPEVKVEVICTDHRLNLARGDADIAIRAGNLPNEPGIVVRKLADDPWSAYCSPAYAEKHGVPKCGDDLNSHWIIGVEGNFIKLNPFIWLADAAPRAKVRNVCNSGVNMLAAIKAGHGVGLLPKIAVYGAERDLIECFAVPEFDSGFYLATRSDLKDVPRIRSFSEFIVARMPAAKAILEGRSDTTRERQNAPAAT
jgi:DNA-binding transcriptional LysR family regulator